MKKTTSIMVLLFLVCTSAAWAQTSEPTRVFINVNAGLQAQERTLDSSFAFPIYGQTASVATTQIIGRRAIFDMNVGYRVLPQLGVAVGFGTYSRTGTIAATASIPDPLVFNNPATVDVSASDTKRSDRNIYLLAVWFMPITEQIELDFFAGPTGFRVRQDFIESVTVPAGTKTGTPVLGTRSGRGYGVNVGFDANYMLTKMYGGGIFVRYNGATADLDNIGEVKAGGFQIGIGGRLRF